MHEQNLYKRTNAETLMSIFMGSIGAHAEQKYNAQLQFKKEKAYKESLESSVQDSDGDSGVHVQNQSGQEEVPIQDQVQQFDIIDTAHEDNVENNRIKAASKRFLSCFAKCLGIDITINN